MSLTDQDIEFIKYALMSISCAGAVYFVLSMWLSAWASVLIILIAASSTASVTATAWGSYSLSSVDPTGLSVVLVSFTATAVSAFTFYMIGRSKPFSKLLYGGIYLIFTTFMVCMNYLLIAQMLERGAVLNARSQSEEKMVLDLQGQIGDANAALLRAQTELAEITSQERALSAQIAEEARTGCPDVLRSGQASNCKTLKDQRAALGPAREAAQIALDTAKETIERLQAMTSRDDRAEIMNRRGMAQQSIDLYLPAAIGGVTIRQIIAGFVGSMIEIAATMIPAFAAPIIMASRGGWFSRLFRPWSAKAARRMRVKRDELSARLRDAMERLEDADKALARADSDRQRALDLQEAEIVAAKDAEIQALKHQIATERKERATNVLDPLENPNLITEENFDAGLVERFRKLVKRDELRHARTMADLRPRTHVEAIKHILSGADVNYVAATPRNAVANYLKLWIALDRETPTMSRPRPVGPIAPARGGAA